MATNKRTPDCQTINNDENTPAAPLMGRKRPRIKAR